MAAYLRQIRESKEDRNYRTTEDKISKFLYKAAVKLWPPAKIADAMTEDNRDPVTGEYRDPLKKYTQTAEGILDIITLGRGALGKDALKKITLSYFKKIVDWGAEEVVKIATDKLGLGNEKANILYYTVLKLGYELKSGEINDLYKALHAVIKLGNKGVDAVKSLKELGINLDPPKDKKAAVQQALQASGYQNLQAKE